LGVAVAAHALIIALILIRPPSPPVLPAPERMTVSLAEDVAPVSTAPNPAAAAADIAPELGEPAPPEASEQIAEPDPVPEPEPQPKAKPEPRVAPAPQPRPKPVARPAPKPKPKPAPRAKPEPRPARPAAKAPAKASSNSRSSAPAKAPPAKQAGGSRIGADFLKGSSNSDSASTGTPAATIGPAERASLASAISRQLKPKWAAPSGADAELLVTVLAWSMNRDGSLSGTPRVVRQEGITDSNRPQAARHAEQAVRAVQLAAPFNLPEKYYDAWKRVASFRFDRKLSQ